MATDPVKPTTEMAGWRVRLAPHEAPGPVTTLTTPLGSPTSVQIWAKARQLSVDNLNPHVEIVTARARPNRVPSLVHLAGLTKQSATARARAKTECRGQEAQSHCHSGRRAGQDARWDCHRSPTTKQGAVTRSPG
eukprot:SAG11_NODE_2934_length_2828_cov_1.446684_5_plen_135_part_00